MVETQLQQHTVRTVSKIGIVKNLSRRRRTHLLSSNILYQYCINLSCSPRIPGSKPPEPRIASPTLTNRQLWTLLNFSHFHKIRHFLSTRGVCHTWLCMCCIIKARAVCLAMGPINPPVSSKRSTLLPLVHGSSSAAVGLFEGRGGRHFWAGFVCFSHLKRSVYDIKM